MAQQPINPSKKSPSDPVATTVLFCPTCKKRTPHTTKGVERAPEGGGQKSQPMKCAICGTVTNPRTGHDGRDFQANVDADDGM